MTTHAAHADHQHNDMAHVASAKMLLGVFFTLIVLTVLTVKAAGIGLGAVDLWIAMIIATIKATLVGLYFMHLRYDKPFHAIVFLSSFIFVAVFLGFALMDTSEYNPQVDWADKTPVAPAAAPAEGGGH